VLKRELLELLCCPKCKSDLDYRPAENTLTCTRCATVYPVRNDIPILLVDPPVAHVPQEAHEGLQNTAHGPHASHDDQH
jgi:uncharacterized protein